MPPAPARDVALGLAVVGVRGAVVGVRLLTFPARVASRALLTDRTTRRLATEGRASRLRVRAQLTTTGGELLAAPEVDALGRALAEHRVVERVARPVLEAPDVEVALTSMLESRLAAQMTDQLLRSPELERAVEQIASSAAVRAAMANQTTSLVGELSAGLRRRAERIDDAAERTARRWLRRPQRSQPV